MQNANAETVSVTVDPSSDASSESLERGVRALRVGGIDYLNSLPLLWKLEESDGIDLAYHVPSRLATMLHAGELDVALIPIAAYADRPDHAIVPGLGISSYGGVRSIRLYFRRPLDEVVRVGLDTCSRTSALLTRLLFREQWGGEPEFVRAAPDELHTVLSGDRESDLDAALLIGDAALERGIYAGWEDVDLGTEWTRWTGLPFVYAFWAVRDEGLEDDELDRLVRQLHEARREGTKHIDEIVRRARLPEEFSESDAIHYLNHVIRYDLGDDELRAMRLFLTKARDAGLVDFDCDQLRFLTQPS